MEIYKKSSFFEHIGIADRETIHSGIIAWIFSNDCEAFSENQKSTLIKKLFGLNNTSKIIKTITEYKNIDILIDCEDCVIVIENKIKSSQHSNQLYKYKKTIQCDFKDKSTSFFFLTLISENPNTKNWKDLSYETLLNVMLSAKLTKHNDSLFVDEYLKYLNKMVLSLKYFLENSIVRDYVFLNGATKKYDKKTGKLGLRESFIAKNQLETIYQKAFWYKTMENTQLSKFEYEIDETRGSVLINLIIKEFRNIYNDILFVSLIQIQNKAVKFAIKPKNDYKKSKKEWLNKVEAFFNEETKDEFDFIRINKPKTKAFMSFSKTLDENYWLLEYKELIKLVTGFRNIGVEISNELDVFLKNPT